MSENFIERRKANWKRLEELIDQARTVRGLRGLSRDEVRELGRSYRRVGGGLAVAPGENPGQRLGNLPQNPGFFAPAFVYCNKHKKRAAPPGFSPFYF